MMPTLALLGKSLSGASHVFGMTQYLVIYSSWLFVGLMSRFSSVREGSGGLIVPKIQVAFPRTAGTRSLFWCFRVWLATRKPNSQVVVLYWRLLKYFHAGGQDYCLSPVEAKMREPVGEMGTGQISGLLKSKAGKEAAWLSGWSPRC